MSDINSSLPIKTYQPGDVDVFLSDPNTPSQKLKIESDGSINARNKQSDGTDITLANPLPVVLSEFQDETFDYDTQAALASSATDNHDFAVPADFKLTKVIAGASGRGKFVLQRETAVASGLYDTIAVKFNSTANPNVDFDFPQGINVLSGVKIRVARTNNENQAQDVYSTIYGFEV